MALDWEHGALAEGLRCYRSQQFFLAHEHWESVWLRSAEPEKTFLQALIQIAAAFHHLQRQNSAGAASLLAAALGRLEAFPPTYGGLDVESIRQSISTWLQALDSGDFSPQLPCPQIG
jgi:uncharacterized protein